MKIVIMKTNLKEGLSAVERISGDGTQLPILKNVLLETEQNKIKCTATNLEIAITYYASCKIIENGKVTAPMHTLSALIGNLQNERLSLEAKGHNVEIKTDNYEAVVNGLPADDYPFIPKIAHTEECLEIDGGVLRESLGQVLIATQVSELRPELASILFVFSLNSLTLVATDSFRLAEKTIGSSQLQHTFKKGFRVLVPMKTAQELVRMLIKGEQVKVFLDPNQVLFKTDSFELISRLLEGTFPDYQAVIPKEFGAELVVHRQELLQALKLASVFGSRNNEVKIRPTENKKAIEVFSLDQALGENKYVLPAKIKGECKEVVFNWRYLSDGLKALTSEEVFIGMNEENKPALIKTLEDGSYFYILVPILKA